MAAKYKMASKTSVLVFCSQMHNFCPISKSLTAFETYFLASDFFGILNGGFVQDGVIFGKN
jgi:hypothetical protein